MNAAPKKCSQCGSSTMLYRVERDENKKKIFICSKHPKQEQKVKTQSIHDKDQKFYEFIWKKREHFCEECGKEIKECRPIFFHHLLPKAKFKYFRHDERNIAILCYTCHGKAESAMSYSKMKMHERFERIKEKLLEEVGINYKARLTLFFP